MLNIQEKIPLAPLTSFRIGGDALYYVEIKNEQELREALAFAQDKNIDFYILAGGSNVLFSDNGFAGLIIRPKMNEVFVDENSIEAEAGAPLIKVINNAASVGLAGIESLAGIPGTVGGAARGNAGAFGSEIGEKISSIKYFDCKTLEIKSIEAKDCDFDYRSSIFKNDSSKIILSVSLQLVKGDLGDIKRNVSETIIKRTSRGLHGVRSAGSYFMNPIVTNEKLLEEFAKENGAPSKNGKLPAGWIIDQLGIRGKQIGGAAVSEQHANYIINKQDAKAEEVIMLASYIKQQVRDKMGVQLSEEVNYVGF